MPFVQVTMVAGRTTEQKHALIAKVSEAVSSALDTPVDRVRVAIYEVSPDEWGIGGQPYAIARGASATVAASASPSPDGQPAGEGSS
jgi:4-oxalocrotonate tautomerase family enzyme